MADPTFPARLAAFPIVRGDSATFEVAFHHEPPAWAPNTAYVTGVVGSGVYLADSTVSYAGTTYTCTAAHTSGAAFDASYWAKDPKAVGEPYDQTALGTVTTAMARLLPDGQVLITFDTSATDLAAGLVVVSVAAADWQAIGAQFPAALTIGFDVQVADAATPGRVTTIIAGSLAVDPDYTHAPYGGQP